MSNNQIVAQPDGYYYKGRRFKTLQGCKSYKDEVEALQRHKAKVPFSLRVLLFFIIIIWYFLF